MGQKNRTQLPNDVYIHEVESMTRRSLLKLFAAILASGHDVKSSWANFERNSATKSKRILVIGAGLAGLSAARKLREMGYEVLIVEGRDRIGGRLWTSSRWPDIPIDLGASWIHGVDGNPLTKLAESANAKLLSTSYERSVLFNTDGKPLLGDQEAQLEYLRKRLKKAIRTAQENDEDVTLHHVLGELASELKANSEMRRLLNFLISGEIEQEYAGSSRKLSAQWYDSAKSFDGGDAILAKGYQVIVDFLARGLTMERGQTVREIDWSHESVRIKTEQNEYQADQVLVTLPLGVLKSGTVKFVPELPAANKKAISALEMGVLNKCYLRFDEVFWPNNVDWIEYIPNQHGEWTEWVSFTHAARIPVLLGFNAADRGREIESWSDAKIVSSAMQTLRTIFGNDIPDPIDFQITRWAKDPFALGSYSFNPVGSHPSQRHQLAKPLNNRVFFAGEATEVNYFGTAHGAYLSGLRAADEIDNS